MVRQTILRRVSTILWLFLFTLPAFAQPEPLDDKVAEKGLSEQVEQDGDDLFDELESYRRAPIDLYRARPEDLARLPGISLQTALGILNFIDRFAPADIRQLAGIPDLSAEQLTVLLACTRLGPETIPEQHPTSISVRTRVRSDLQTRRGYRDELQRISLMRDPITGDSLGLDTIAVGTPYLGGRQAVLTRITVRHRNLSGNITIEKDAGEPWLLRDTLDYAYRALEYIDPAVPVIDVRQRLGIFTSAHLRLNHDPLTIHLGDFTAELGQGLVLGRPFGGMKGSNVLGAPFRSARGIVGSRSANEVAFFRGIALTLHEGIWLPAGLTADLFASHRCLDASLDDAESPGGEISSIREDGYHRTHGEIRGSGTTTETLVGGALRYRFDAGRIGITGYRSRSSAGLASPLHYRHRGTDHGMLSVDGRLSIGEISIFGELAGTVDGILGGVAGVSTHLAALGLTTALRYLPARFHTPHGTGFGEAPAAQHNEYGLYVGLSAPLNMQARLSAYIDLYRHPERSFRVPFPVAGSDGLLTIDYRLTPALRLSARARIESAGDARSLIDTSGVRHVIRIDRTTASGRVEMNLDVPASGIELRGRFERRMVEYGSAFPAANGLLTFLEMRLQPVESLRLGARLTLFRTEDYDARLYAFEPDLPGTLINRPLSGSGRRFSVDARWRPLPALTLSVKYAATHYIDRERIGERTLQEIDGPTEQSIGVQLDLEL